MLVQCSAHYFVVIDGIDALAALGHNPLVVLSSLS